MELKLTELFEFLKTPEAQALTSDEEKLAAAQRWKNALQEQPQPVEFDVAAHVEALKSERSEWLKNADSWGADDKKAVWEQRINQLDIEIENYTQELNNA